VEYFTASDFFPSNEINASTERLTTPEYVQILNDVVNLNKNLCIARHFTQFDREVALK
jgi:hypothetical protein